MKKSYFNPQTHIGKQPVRVLKWNIAHTFEHIHPTFSKEFLAILQKHGLQPCIAYDYSERSIIDSAFPNRLTPFVDEKKQITIQETFLSLVWTMCYSHLVLFEERNQKPILNRLYSRNHTIDDVAIKGAEDLYKYGVGLVRNYKPWDKTNLPNPEEYSAEEFYVEKANGVFVLAMVFILCHELAHIELGHIDTYIPTADLPLAEAEADRRAIQIMLKGTVDKITKVNYGVGMLLGFCSLLTLKRELSSSTHPHLASRIQGVLEAQEFDDISPIWGIASMSFQLWDHLYNGTKHYIQWPNQADSFKELFYQILSQLK